MDGEFMNTIDLHVHSTISDGTMTPKELVFYAKEKGLTAFALTDHDTISGLDETISTGKQIDMEIIPGIELAAQYQNVELHILGYYIDYQDPYFIKELKYWQKERERRNDQMIHRLNKLGFPITKKDLQLLSGGKIITRAHYGKWFFKNGYVQNITEAFKKYIGSDCPGYVRRNLPTPKDCIQIIKQAKGIPVLAHPFLYGFSKSKLYQVIQFLIQTGLEGLEAIYSLHTAEQEKTLRQIAKKHGLLITGGSDFHGKNKPHIDIGVGMGNLYIPYEILTSIKQTLKDR